jgi:hypothetical protein
VPPTVKVTVCVPALLMGDAEVGPGDVDVRPGGADARPEADAAPGVGTALRVAVSQDVEHAASRSAEASKGKVRMSVSNRRAMLSLTHYSA